MNTQLVNDLIHDYLDDPNCCPADWIASEEVTEEEKNAFLSGIKGAREARRRANFIAPDDTPSLDAPWYAFK